MIGRVLNDRMADVGLKALGAFAVLWIFAGVYGYQNPQFVHQATNDLIGGDPYTHSLYYIASGLVTVLLILAVYWYGVRRSSKRAYSEGDDA